MTREQFDKACKLDARIDDYIEYINSLKQINSISHEAYSSLGLNLSFVNVPSGPKSSIGTDRELRDKIIKISLDHYQAKLESAKQEFEKL